VSTPKTSTATNLQPPSSRYESSKFPLKQTTQS